ncbi:MAG: PHP domain-containing protein [Armatimonadetes bacterium]|nr:PHP domain-containing protein [Armatimonadota bacterium]
MKNYQVASVFENIADLMEIDGDSPFKIHAYRYAADTMRSLTDNLEELVERDELRNVPGVGEAIESKTREILATGTCELYERLRAKLPPTLIELLELPGVGPRTVRLLFEGLHVTNLAELKEAAENGRVQALPRMGPRAQERILEGIAQVEARPNGLPFARALAATESLAGQLAHISGVLAVYEAGDRRRYEEFCSEIVAVASAHNPSGALDAFVGGFPKGDAKVVLPFMAQAKSDLGPIACYAEEPAFAGGAVVRATGSERHLQRLEEMAAQRGLKYAGTRLLRSDGTPLEAPDEETFYSLLDLPHIPAEIRNGDEEIDAAIQGRLPELITVEDLLGDLHCHTDASDGHGTALEMAEAARARGYEYLAITDHSQALTVARGLTPERLEEQGRIIDEVNRSSRGFRLLKGTEVDIRQDGALDLPDNALAKLEWVNASIHTGFELSEEQTTTRAIRAIESPYVDVLSHPTGRLIAMREPYALNLDTVISAAVEHSKAMEINSSVDRLDLSGPNARRARDAGVKIVISTDSHRPNGFGAIEHGIGVARRAWLTKDDVVNTMSWEAIRAWKSARPK